MNYRIEPAEEKHLASIAEISKAAARLFSLEDLPESQRSTTPPLNLCRVALNENKLWVAVSESNNNPVGFALVVTKCGHPHLAELDVHPQHGRQGVGQKLLETVIRQAKKDKCEQLTLTTFRHLPWNAPFYSRSGFKIIEQSELNPYQLKLIRDEAEGLNLDKRVLMILTF